ncbi:MAG: DNA repair protein RadC [Gammaproteobacteria bacterium]|nr:DNA repair protein RadC [Gammaproteobacteria bacterium]
MAISDWPAQERPREKLLQKGADALSDAELLAIFLRTGVQGYTAVDLARFLLDDFGGLRPLLEAGEAEFCQRHGLGPAKFVQLQAVLEMARRHLFENIQRGDALCSPAETRRYLQTQLQNHPHEVFACLFLDNRNRVISFDKMFYGTIDGASVYPREVVKLALKKNAAAVIFAHNHPSGVAEPSRSDEQITQRLKKALEVVDIRVLDHMVIGDEVVSFAERGIL